MIKNFMLYAALLCSPALAFAHNINLEQKVPAVSVSDKGELLLNNNKFSYQNWDSGKLIGKVRVIQHIAGRSAAKELNAPLIEEIKRADFSKEKYQTTTIINVSDAIFGTGPFVRSSIEDSKKEFPWSQFIADSNGVAKKTWQLEPKNSAIIVLDKNGVAKFAKEGKLNSNEIKQVIELVRKELQ
ncbi:YtfJ family protein [Photorhabdus khanii]|uniref:YtfJ family protein n=1 Tax=Photorhabdus khanii subsp. guanajuatensis TaxID=2100166 RepID=A0A4R4K206_9GAMM|nr:YtfJ family protein [Photorhabdus khanii]TDB61243.1 YtfJ family protein [Photorhabdus khanii subsp. guanajuatensis]